jgi:peptidoglycan/LPS O-acetylase OafA/YrhL
VLSGFLIGGILIRTVANTQTLNGKQLLTFWLRRWFRTLPNYFLILIMLCLLHIVVMGNFSLWDVKSYFLFLQNFNTPQAAFFPESWSLTIEEWFYLLIPLLLALLIALKVSPQKSTLIVAVSVMVAVTLFRVYRYYTIPVAGFDDWDMWFRKQVVTRLDSLMFGVLGAYCQHYFKEKWLKHKTLLLVIGIFMFLLHKLVIAYHTPYDGLFCTVFSFTYISVATLLLLPFLSDYKSAKGIAAKAATFISLISYSIYLLHITVLYFISCESMPWNQWLAHSVFLPALQYVAYWGVTILCSWLLYRFWELKMMNLRDKIYFPFATK